MNIIEQFRTIYFSKKNSDYIRDYVFNKYNIQDTDYSLHQSLDNILSSIFDSYQQTITNEFIQKQGKIDHENILIQLNKMAMVKFESLLQQNQPYSHEKENKYIDQNVQTNIIIHNSKFTQTHLEEKKQEIQLIETKKETNSGHLPVKTPIHFFSEDVNYITDDGVFVYDFSNLKLDVSAITLNSFKFRSDLYNIQLNNNFFTIIENGITKKITIPIGYYTLSQLILEINKVLIDIKSNCTVVYEEIKNRVCIENTSTKYKTFDILFPQIETITIGELLGFNEKEYRNNNLYIAEILPDVELFNDIFLRIFINDTELKRINTTKENFTYFTLLSYENKTIMNQPNLNYHIPKCSVNTISFQLLCNPFMPISSNISFEIVLYFN